MMWTLPPLNALRAFEATARLGTMTAAAHELHVTQVAITRQIATLEEALHTKLFVRDARRVRLTDAGRSLFDAVSKSFRELQCTVESINGTTQKHLLKVCGYTNFTMRWLIPRLPNFREAHPDIDIQLRSSMDAVDFERSDLDVAIRSGSGDWPDWHCTLLAPIDLIPVCSPTLAGAGAGDAQAFVRQLRAHKLLHSSARPDDWARWLDVADVPGVDPHSGISFDNGSLAYQAAIEGVGVAIAQRVLVEEDLRSGRLVAPIDLAVSSGESYFLVVPDRRLSPKVKAFSAWLTREAELARAGTLPQAPVELSQ